MTSSVSRNENEGLPIGAFVRFRENSNDKWRAGKIHEYVGQTGTTYRYKVHATWRSNSGWAVVNHSDSLLQRVPDSDHVDMICSEFDRFVANCDEQVPLVWFNLKKGGTAYVEIETTENGTWACSLPHTEKMVKNMVTRFGTSLQQHCKDLKRCRLHCDSRFGLGAIDALVGGIASASNPNATELVLSGIFEPVLFDSICKELVSKKKNILRKLRLIDTKLSSLRHLKGLAGSLRTLSFNGVEPNDEAPEDLDEFFEIQATMERPVLQRLEVSGNELFSGYMYEDVVDPFQQILHSLGKHNFLKALKLHVPVEHEWPGVEASNIKQFLLETDVLEELHLEGCPLKDEDLDTILVGLPTCSSLKELTMNPDSTGKVEKIVTALETHPADKQQGVRVLTLASEYPDSYSFLKNASDFEFLLKQLERLPALRHVHLEGGDVPLGQFLESGCDKILLDFLQHSHPLEIFEWDDIWKRGKKMEMKPALDEVKASADALCRANRVFNRCVPRLLGTPDPKADKKEIPPPLWSTLLASVLPQSNALFKLLHAYPNLVESLNTAGGSVKKN